MRRRGKARASFLAIALACTAAAVSGCGSDSAAIGSSVGSNTLTVYSSLPLRGAAAAQSRAIINAEKLALEQVGGRVGPFTVRYSSLDDSSPKADGWDPGVASTNARAAVQDRSTIAYLGDFDAGASAVSIPLLNSASILQISPSNSVTGLTQSAGADKGEPEKYYPATTRTFGRLVPSDDVQAAAQLRLQRARGCSTTFLADDTEIEGEAIVRRIAELAASGTPKVTGGEGVAPKATDFGKLVDKVRKSGADCLFFASSLPMLGAAVFEAVHAQLPDVKLFGSAGLAQPEFAGALRESTARVTRVTSPALPARMYPASGQRFFRDYKAKYGQDAPAYAIYGYEAMRAALAAIRAAGPAGNDRRAVVKQFFATRARHSPIGTYSIDANGDAGLSSYAAYRVAAGKLVFSQLFKTG